MNSRERIKKILARKGADRCGLWLGIPKEETLEIYLKALELKDRDDLCDYLGEDCRWLYPDWVSYKHPNTSVIWNTHQGEDPAVCSPGVLANCTSVKELETFDWPETKYLDFTETIDAMDKYQDSGIFSGMWGSFFQIVSYFVGMENHFVMMHTHPEVVEALTEKIVNFYLEANELYFKQAGDKFDIFFFGNDFGTQLDLLISPKDYDKFILPGLKRLVEQAKRYDKYVLMHSCGAIDKIIPSLIDIGIDAIHPLQAKAKDMDAKSLAEKYSNDLAFVGGTDIQDLLVNATPDQVKEEVRRVKDILGPNYIVSPSHEAILPNVPLGNILAMAEVAKE